MNARTLLFLAALAGAPSAQVSTIRVEIDYMEDGLHSHRPEQAEIDAVVQMFACQGIDLVVVIDDAIPHASVIACSTPGLNPFFNCTNAPNSFANLEATHRDFGSGWHYAIFGHVYDDGDGINSSGIAELPGDAFLVADGIFSGNPTARPYWRAATFAHELGHNLGLEHSAPGSTGDDPYAPNLPSVMSYRYQLRGVASQLECQGLVGARHLFKDLDYSSGRLPVLNEGSLREARGMGIVPVDWDCDDFTDPLSVSRNLDAESDWCTQGTDNDVLLDYDEWSAIDDVALLSTDGGPLPFEQRTVRCADLATLLAPNGCTPQTPTLTIEPCETGEMVFVADGVFLPGTGTGTLPYEYLDVAVAASPVGSILYLQPGTIGSSTGTKIRLDKPMVITGPGGAVATP